MNRNQVSQGQFHELILGMLAPFHLCLKCELTSNVLSSHSLLSCLGEAYQLRRICSLWLRLVRQNSACWRGMPRAVAKGGLEIFKICCCKKEQMTRYLMF